jgi:hypothetical protein
MLSSQQHSTLHFPHEFDLIRFNFNIFRIPVQKIAVPILSMSDVLVATQKYAFTL